MGGRLFGGGSLGRINKQAKRSAKLIMPALIRVVVLNPRPEENKLFIMIGWTTAPTADPAEAKVIAKVRFFLKYSERTAMLGTYIIPPANPIPIPCVRKICKRWKGQTSLKFYQDQGVNLNYLIKMISFRK